MTNEEMIADLKQFIAATVKQEVAGVEERLTAKIDGVEERLDTKIDGVEQRLTKQINDAQAAIGEAIANETDRVDARFDEHDRRLRRLESRAA